jgi:hypothetical protein
MGVALGGTLVGDAAGVAGAGTGVGVMPTPSAQAGSTSARLNSSSF